MLIWQKNLETLNFLHISPNRIRSVEGSFCLTGETLNLLNLRDNNLNEIKEQTHQNCSTILGLYMEDNVIEFIHESAFYGSRIFFAGCPIIDLKTQKTFAMHCMAFRRHGLTFSANLLPFQFRSSSHASTTELGSKEVDNGNFPSNTYSELVYHVGR